MSDPENMRRKNDDSSGIQPHSSISLFQSGFWSLEEDLGDVLGIDVSLCRDIFHDAGLKSLGKNKLGAVVSRRSVCAHTSAC